MEYNRAGVDGLVSSDGDKSRGWKKSVHIFYFRYFFEEKETAKMRNNTNKKKNKTALAVSAKGFWLRLLLGRRMPCHK